MGCFFYVYKHQSGFLQFKIKLFKTCQVFCDRIFFTVRKKNVRNKKDKAIKFMYIVLKTIHHGRFLFWIIIN